VRGLRPALPVRDPAGGVVTGQHSHCARVWRLYLAASALAFEQLRTGVNQVLAVRPDEQLRSGLPPTRAQWLC
jgi:hypothetical protein